MKFLDYNGLATFYSAIKNKFNFTGGDGILISNREISINCGEGLNTNNGELILNEANENSLGGVKISSTSYDPNNIVTTVSNKYHKSNVTLDSGHYGIGTNPTIIPGDGTLKAYIPVYDPENDTRYGLINPSQLRSAVEAFAPKGIEFNISEMNLLPQASSLYLNNIYLLKGDDSSEVHTYNAQTDFKNTEIIPSGTGSQLLCKTQAFNILPGNTISVKVVSSVLGNVGILNYSTQSSISGPSSIGSGTTEISYTNSTTNSIKVLMVILVPSSITSQNFPKSTVTITSNNVYEEYICVRKSEHSYAWEKLGTFNADGSISVESISDSEIQTIVES